MTQLTCITPIPRSFDKAKARQCCLDFLGFRVVFERRFELGLPLYMGIARDDCTLHLSEHHARRATSRSLTRSATGSRSPT